MNARRDWPLFVWAVRDLIRRPGEALLLFAALTILVAGVGTTGLLSRALAWTYDDLLQRTPALVVRRIQAGGWVPLPVAAALESVRDIPGAINARTRLWGTAASANGPLTVVAESAAAGLLPAPPKRGQALVGPGVALDPEGKPLRLQAAETLTLSVAGRLPESAAMAVHDVVVVHPDDARRLLGIPSGTASDLCLDVFHDDEAQALLPELTTAFPWPVRIQTRREVSELHHSRRLKQGTMGFVVLLPAILGLMLVAAAVVRGRPGGFSESGLLKALGWTGPDLIRLHLFQALALGLPAAAAGAVLASGLVFWPGVRWVGRLFLGWNTSAPPLNLYLDATGTGTVLAESILLVLVPYLAAALWPSFKAAAADPAGLIEGGRLL